jgi:hypothetical protein
MKRAAGLLHGCVFLLCCTPYPSEPRTEQPAHEHEHAPRPAAASGDRAATNRPAEQGETNAKSPPAPALLTLGGVTLTLEGRAGRCVVRPTDGEVIELSLPAPCDFHRGPSGAPRVESPAGEPTVLVEWSVRDSTLPNDCDTQLQALRMHSGRVQASEHVSRVAACPPFQWDAKIFFALFE